MSRMSPPHPGHDGGVGQRRGNGEETPASFRRERQPALDRRGSVIDEEPRLRAERGHGRAAFQEGELPGEPVGMGDIVGVHEGDDPRTGPVDPLLERRREAAVGAAAALKAGGLEKAA
jgi:hypothetical protein